ncbi:hypothetical protein GQ457_17G002560 [Hibiscus cannabinus]
MKNTLWVTRVRSSIEPLGSFLPALNALLQLRVSILTCKTSFKKVTVVKRGIDTHLKEVSILGLGYRYQDWVSILKNLTGILNLVLHIRGYRYSRVGIDTHLGYRYSNGVSVLKNLTGILESFKT